jgi:21S rRNA (uridine2791-2'-O)-methyltransferase
MLSQVAVNRTSPNGRVVGIDIIPTQPPKGVSTIQGNFLSPTIQAEVRAYVQDPDLGRPRREVLSAADSVGLSEKELENIEQGYVDIEQGVSLAGVDAEAIGQPTVEDQETPAKKLTLKERDSEESLMWCSVTCQNPGTRLLGFIKGALVTRTSG